MKSWENEQIIKDFKWYYEKGYITARDGNACYKNEAEFVVTCSGSEKHKLTNKDFVIVDDEMEIVGSYGKRKPSIETGAHIAALIQSGKNASVHVHSPNTVALAALFDSSPGTHTRFGPREYHLVEVLNKNWPELFRYTKVGAIVPFLDPGSKLLHGCITSNLSYWTEEFSGDPDGDDFKMEEVKKYNDIVIMQQHGVLTIGDDFDQCMEHIVRLEHISTILLKIISASGNIESIL